MDLLWHGYMDGWAGGLNVLRAVGADSRGDK
jgi:hypothetical protein